MSWPESAISRGLHCIPAFLLPFLAILALYASSIVAQEFPDPADRTEVWLVTYGPGEIYWQRFGHNAIWIRDPGLGLDHVFNFGFFDFDQESFLLRFIQGRLLYFSAAVPARHEFAQYINENRSIRAQRLSLAPDQALSLTDYLVNEVQPENREYLYDYYWNNCSTRVRDALDAALGGKISDLFAGIPARQNFRDHTRRLTIPDYWLYLGLELGLGSPVDQPVSRWDEFFIPGQLAEAVGQMGGMPAQSGDPLVLEDVMLYVSTAPPPPVQTAQWWPRYLAIPAVLLAILLLLSRILPAGHALVTARAWLTLSAIIGCMMVYFWLFTDHQVARDNVNLALFNPLWILCLAGRRFFSLVAWLLTGLGLVALVMPLAPPHQYTLDVLAVSLPFNFAAARVLFRARPG